MRNKTDNDFFNLINEVQNCRTCPRMDGSARVLNHASGPLNSPIMFIGEAPGRLGADGSEIPFHGDKAGNNFEALLAQVGLDRYSAFITNAALCNPKDEKGNNATPSSQEIRACSSFLRRQIDLVNPRLVVTLGAAALSAVSLIESHSFALRTNVRTSLRWYNRILIPAYHPGQRAMIHRGFSQQLADYQFIAETFRRLDVRAKAVVPKAPSADVRAIIDFITREKIELSYFAVHKLFYLLECEAVRQSGHRLTSSFIIRQKDGPYCTELHISKLKKAFPDLKTFEKNNSLFIRRSPSSMFENMQFTGCLSGEVRELANMVLKKYENHTDAQLKTAAYLTSPMRQLLRLEKNEHRNMFNVPINFDH